MSNSEIIEWEIPESIWEMLSYQPPEYQGLILSPPPPAPPLPTGRPGLRPPIWRRPRTERLPQGVANVRCRRECVGLDLICNTCHHYIPKSERCRILCHFYAPQGRWGSPLTRCYVRCPNCYDDIELGRNIGDADNFVVIGGATQHFPAAENTPSSDPDLKNEAYPDALLDSPNDIRPRVIELQEVDPSLSDDDVNDHNMGNE